MENILIDTDVVIEYLRTKDKSKSLLIELIQRHDVFLTPITEFELFLGAKTTRHNNDLKMLFISMKLKSCLSILGVVKYLLISGRISKININTWKLETFLLPA